MGDGRESRIRVLLSGEQVTTATENPPIRPIWSGAKDVFQISIERMLPRPRSFWVFLLLALPVLLGLVLRIYPPKDLPLTGFELYGIVVALFFVRNLLPLVALLFDHASASSKTAHGIVARVNAEFFSVLRGHSFMTACCVIIDSGGRLSFAGAGHPPLLIRRSNGIVEALPSLNTMMGINAEMAVSETKTTLVTGDVALIRLLGRSGLNTSQAVEKIREEIPGVAEVEDLLQFIATSERGFVK